GRPGCARPAFQRRGFRRTPCCCWTRLPESVDLQWSRPALDGQFVRKKGWLASGEGGVPGWVAVRNTDGRGRPRVIMPAGKLETDPQVFWKGRERPRAAPFVPRSLELLSSPGSQTPAYFDASGWSTRTRVHC